MLQAFSLGHNTGRCFTILRHPIDRAVAVFYSLKRKGVKAVKDMSILEYANSHVAEDNWLTRVITNTMEGELTQQHCEVAKEVFGRKCLVGFLDNLDKSIERMGKFFMWEEIKSVNTHHSVMSSTTGKDMAGKRACSQRFVEHGVNRHPGYARVHKGSPVWAALGKKNKYDIQLYQYAKALYHQQDVVYAEMTD